MEINQLLDSVPQKVYNRYTNLSLKAFVTTIIFLFLFLFLLLLLGYDNSRGKLLGNISVISFIGMLISTIIGFVFTIMSYVKKEVQTTLKTLLTIANLFLFFIVLGLLSFIFMDMFAATSMQNEIENMRE